MPFFEDAPKTSTRQKHDIALFHQMECRACPLDKLKNNKHPHMPATGSDQPLVYILGEGPGKTEDEEGEQFVGESGELLRPKIPRHYRDRVRFNNVVRTRPFKNETPDKVSIECCRPSVVRDIENSKPRAIFGFGNIPLEWVSGFSGVTLWRGRKMPVKVGNHSCWYYPMLHPAFLLRQRRGNDEPSEDERMFKLDLKRAFDEVEKLPAAVVHTPAMVFNNVECITNDIRQVRERFKWARKQTELGFDYETNALRPYGEKAKILTFAWDNGEEGFACPLDHPEAEWTTEEREEVIALLTSFMREHKGRKFVHNLAFEHEWTAVYFKDPYLIRASKWEDSTVQACILDERKGKQKPGCFSLEFLVQQYFGFNLKKLSNVDRANLSKLPVEVVLKYNGGDARYHCLLGLAQEIEIEYFGLEEAYGLALRRVPTVVLTQVKGLPVDQTEVKVLQKKYDGRLKALADEEKHKGEIFDVPVIKKFESEKGVAFKPFSNPDVIHVFRDMLHRPECRIQDKWTKEYKYSANEEILGQIDHPLAKLLIDLRKANKQKSTYIDPLDALLEGNLIYSDGLLHAIFNTIFAETGRLSCDSPNLQNFPKRSGEAKEVRRQIKAPPGCVIVAFDYGQIEARVIAMFTKDKVFCKALWEKYDVHMEWAERIAHAYPARIGGKKFLTDKKAMKDLRTDIKNEWTFPLFFGAKLESAAGYLKIPVDNLRPLYNDFWKQFSSVKTWQDELLEFYREYGYVEGLTGRRRRGPLSLNQVINNPVQGTAAEIVLDGMCRLSEFQDLELQPEINIHDDLTFCRVLVEKVDDIAEKVINEMLGVPFDFVNVPITVEMSVGENWMELEDMGTYSSDSWFK